MSITKMRQLMENKGCAWFMGIIGVLLMVGMVSIGNRGMFAPTGGQSQQSTVVGTLGKQSITDLELSALEAQEEQRSAQAGQDATAGDPIRKAMLLGETIRTVAEIAAIMEIADSMGLKVDDKKALDSVRKSLDDQKAQAVEQLKAQQKIKAGATQAEIDSTIDALVPGGNFKHFVETQMTEFSDKLKDPVQGPIARVSGYATAVKDKIAESVTVSEDDYKKSFDEYNYDVITTSGKDAAGKAISEADAKANAAKAEAELKAGKSFEEVQKIYNVDPKQATMALPKNLLDMYPQKEAILALKQGQPSDVINQFGQYQIMRLKEVTNKLPADYEKTKDANMKSFKENKVAKKFGEIVEAKMKETVWSSKPMDVAFRYAMSQKDPKLAVPGSERDAFMAKLLADAKSASAGNSFEKEVLAFTRMQITNDLFIGAADSDKAKWAKERVDAMVPVLDFAESAKFRTDIAQAAFDANDKVAAEKQLIDAIKFNGSYDKGGLELYATQRGLFDQMKAKNFFDKTSSDNIESAFTKWQADKAAFDKDLAATKSQSDTANKGVQDKLNADIQKGIEEDKKKAGIPVAPPPATDSKPAPATPPANKGK